MKNLLLCLLPLLAAGCGGTTRPGDLSAERWLAAQPDSCLWYYTGLYPSLVQAREYDSLERMYVRLLRAMPPHPKRGPDTEYLTGWVLSYYYNAQVLQDKISGGGICDSLLQSSNPFYNRVMRPELLATAAKFYLAADRRDKADSAAALFLALPPLDDPRREARNCQRMAWALEDAELGTAVPTALIERAEAACRRAGGKVGNEGEIYAYEGYLRARNGNYEGAVASLQEGIDWYLARPGTPGDGLMTAWCDLGNVYREVGLYDEAFEANGEAIRLARAHDGWLLEEMYRFRAALHAEAGRTDSALYYVRQAIASTPESAHSYYLPLLETERIGYSLAADPASAPARARECRLLLRDSARLDPEHLADLHACYGETLLATGRTEEGVRRIESAYRAFLAADQPAGIVRTGRRLIDAYLRTGHADRLAAMYPRHAAVRDSLLGEKSRKAAIGAAIRYRTHRKEQENLLLTAEVALKRRTLTFAWTLTGFLALLLLTGGLYARQRHRYLRRIGEERLARIGLLLRDSERNTAQPPSAERGETSPPPLPQQADLRRKLSSEIFNTDREAEFRRSFTALYPAYLPALRLLARKLTRTDELLAMLLRLELSNDEIALTLGISRSGVNKARSRMRQRLCLESDQNLEAFLRNVRQEGPSEQVGSGHKKPGKTATPGR